MAWFGKSAEALSASGVAYAMKGQYDRAITDFDEAIRLNPKYADALYNRGSAYAMKGQYDRAVADYNEAIRIDPKYSKAFAARGSAYSEKGQYDRAVADHDEAIRLDPENVVSFGARGGAYAMKGQYDHAIADYDEAIRLDPKYAVLFAARGDVYAMKGQYDRAVADYDEAIRLDPNFTRATEMRAMAIEWKNETGGKTEPLAQNSNSSEPVNFAEHSNQTEACNDEDAGYDGDLMTEDDLLAGLEGLAPRDTPDKQFLENPKLITEDDVENYGYGLIDLIKRVAKEAVGPELTALRQSFPPRFADTGANNAPHTKLITPEDEQNYGHELIDLIKRAAKEAVGPELNALRQEFLSQVAAK